MRRYTAVLFGALVVALAACSDEAPLPVAPETSPALQLSATTALSIDVVCDPEGNNYCDAFASGGSGAGYSFTWINATEDAESADWSGAVPNCSTTERITVYATVTDSNGAEATGYDYYFCT